MVWQVANTVKIPVVGLGGIMNATDAIEFLLVGATAVQVGTANFIDPAISVKIVDGIDKYLDDNGFKSVSEIVGGMIV
jgi:dihydroorotate dehydrogenase (NAD+) catalytic subunit